jgi:hypothetical protein
MKNVNGDDVELSIYNGRWSYQCTRVLSNVFDAPSSRSSRDSHGGMREIRIGESLKRQWSGNGSGGGERKPSNHSTVQCAMPPSRYVPKWG